MPISNSTDVKALKVKQFKLMTFLILLFRKKVLIVNIDESAFGRKANTNYSWFEN
jgi:hypothetical protein